MSVSSNKFLKWNEIACFKLSDFAVVTVEKAKHYFNPSFTCENKILIITTENKLVLHPKEFHNLVCSMLFTGSENKVENLTLTTVAEQLTIHKKAGFSYESSVKLDKEEALNLFKLGLGWLKRKELQ